MEKLTSSQFNKVKECDICLVDFSANWCGPCRMLKPILEEVEVLYSDIKFFNIDVDECDDIARDLKIFSIPTLMIFKSGEMVDSIIGFVPQDELINFINKNK